MRVLLFAITFFFLSCNTREGKDGYFKAIAANDVPLNPPQKGEWLYHHKEKGQVRERTFGYSQLYTMPAEDH